MSEEAYAFALKNALTEIRNVCPEVQTCFLFNEDAEVVAGDAETPDSTVERVVGSLEGVLEKADTIGGLDSLVVECGKGHVHITSVNDMYLTMIASKGADMRYLETVARVLIPTVIKLLENLSPTSLRRPIPSYTSPKRKSEKDRERRKEPEGKDEKDDIEAKEKEDQTEELEVPSNQLIVESFGGLLVRSDTVQISEDIMSQWKEQLDSEKIDQVEIESFNGKASQCKVKALDDSKLENKAIIRIPEKLCSTLSIKKGELVRVKPVTE